MAVSDEARLAALCDGLSGILGVRPVLATATLAQINLDSRHLVELMILCDEIYPVPILFEELDFDLEDTVLHLHRQILAWLTHDGPARGVTADYMPGPTTAA